MPGDAHRSRFVRGAAPLVAVTALALVAGCGGYGGPSAPATPAPTPTPTPAPPQVSITLAATRPAVGSTLSAQEPVPIMLALTVVSSQDTPGGFVRAELVSGSARCLAAEATGPGLRANVPALFTVGPFVTNPPLVVCTPPFTTTGVRVRFFPATDPTALTPTGTAELPANFQFR